MDESLCQFGGLYTLRGHAGNVTGVAFTPGGDHLATSGIDATIRLWDMADGEQALILTGHTLPVNGVDFSPDGRHLASAGSDGTIRVYIMQVEELMDLTRSRLSRDFTRDECERYLHVANCPDRQP
jgi:WD40 repeat protein